MPDPNAPEHGAAFAHKKCPQLNESIPGSLAEGEPPSLELRANGRERASSDTGQQLRVVAGRGPGANRGASMQRAGEAVEIAAVGKRTSKPPSPAVPNSRRSSQPLDAEIPARSANYRRERVRGRTAEARDRAGHAHDDQVRFAPPRTAHGPQKLCARKTRSSAGEKIPSKALEPAIQRPVIPNTQRSAVSSAAAASSETPD